MIQKVICNYYNFYNTSSQKSTIMKMVLRLPNHILYLRLLKLYLTNITSALRAKILIETFEYYYSHYK
jgi:hypothetical protein